MQKRKSKALPTSKNTRATSTLPKSFLARPGEAFSSEDDTDAEDSADKNLKQPRNMHCHRLRFVDFTPASITSLALTPASFSSSTAFPWSSPSREIVAVGRGNGDIEILAWIGGGTASSQNAKFGNKQSWVTAQILPSPLPINAPVEHLTWIHRATLTADELELCDNEEEKIVEEQKLRLTSPRLFSASGSSELYEWEWSSTAKQLPSSSKSGSIRRRLALPGGAICSLAANPGGSKLVAAVEDGSVHIINVLDQEFSILKTLERATKSRALSVCWGPAVDGEDIYLVTGCTDSCLRKWDVRSGRCVMKMVLDKVRGKSVLVWTTAVLEYVMLSWSCRLAS